MGVIRISGSQALSIAKQLCALDLPVRQAVYAKFNDIDNNIIDTGLAIYFAGPHSFTGEDILELQGHGGPIIQDLLLKEVIRLGARQARAGEFSERAFLNDKIDLAQAEAIADLIDSSTAQAARGAMRSLQGEFSNKVHSLLAELVHLRMYVEAAIDFPEEEIDFLASEELQQRANALREQTERLMKSIRVGQLLRDGFTVVLAGKPNAGKSSLLNCLTGEDTSIVTAIAGTTRDVVRSRIQIRGLPMQLIDTAGLRESDDPIEQEGVKRAAREVLQADRILWIADAEQSQHVNSSNEIIKEEIIATLENAAALSKDALAATDNHNDSLEVDYSIPVDIVYNKIDLTGEKALIQDHAKPDISTAAVNTALRVNIHIEKVLHLSAVSGEGISKLTQHLQESAGYQQSDETVFIARRRHIDALQRARISIDEGFRQLEKTKSPELAAEDFKHAQNFLGEITGEFGSDDLLGRIFAGFCIGK